ncbi:hypothetical protein JQ641_19070 [Bradyrhizobium sp. JYMT SZCCT0180]|nr:hypothetical protein [Bradyrhizobium sp. JYMT SZCCT0180]
MDTQGDPAIVATAVAQAMKWYDAEKIGKSRMAIGQSDQVDVPCPRAARAITSLRPSGCGCCFTCVINTTAPASSRPKYFYIEREYVQFG